MAERTLAYYRRLPYTRRVRVEEENGDEFFVAYVEELDGVEADGETRFEALYRLNQAFEDYVKAMIEWDEPIPEPEKWPGDISQVYGTADDDADTISEEEAKEGASFWGDQPPLWKTVSEEDLVTA